MLGLNLKSFTVIMRIVGSQLNLSANFFNNLTLVLLQDPNRLHYEPWELQVFERIECQWPMFFALFVLDGLFNGREEQVC